MKVLIIEDEKIAIQQLKNYLYNIDTSFEIVGELSSIEDCIKWFIANEQPDIIFSDIELLDGNVFTFLDKHDIYSPIIFTTAYNQYLLKAFDSIGVGYLLKPYTESQINKALDKCRMLKSSHKKSYNSEIISTVKTVLKSASHFEYKKRLIIKLPSGLYILPVENISLIQAKEALLFAFDFSGKKYPLTGTLMQIYQQLNPDAFFKINRGTVINVEAIEKIENETSDRLSISLKGQKGNFTISSPIIPEFRKWVNS